VTLSVAEVDGTGNSRLVGSATPNVVPAGASVQVTFLFPADGGWIYVDLRPGDGGGLVNADQIGIPGKIWIPVDGNPRPGEGGLLVSSADIGIPGKIVIQKDGQAGWASP